MMVGMGIEDEVKRRRTRRNITKMILGTLGVAGGLAVAVSVPNALQLAAYLPGMSKGKRLYNEGRAFSRLLANGDIEIKKTKNGSVVSLTAQGRSHYLKVMQTPGGSFLKPPLRWDGRWRMVVYDIPEKRRAIRQTVSNLLRAQGFYRLQSSVWIYPYDCEELIVLLKTELKIGKGLLYGILEHIEYDAPLKQHFSLK
jgi:hypothetical protein